jgi:hypothetical protein
MNKPLTNLTTRPETAAHVIVLDLIRFFNDFACPGDVIRTGFWSAAGAMAQKACRVSDHSDSVFDVNGGDVERMWEQEVRKNTSSMVFGGWVAG